MKTKEEYQNELKMEIGSQLNQSKFHWKSLWESYG